MIRTAYVDPGSKTGLALYLGGPVPTVALLDHPSPALIRSVVLAACNLGVVRLVIEDQHAPRIDTAAQRKRFNFKTLKSLVRTAGRWATIGELEGMEIDWIMPTTWQSKSFESVPGVGEDGKKLSTKARSKMIAARTWKDVPRFWPQGKTPTGPDEPKLAEAGRLPIDICDAAVMGRWDQLHGDGR